MIRINCDIGERGARHPVDIELMGLIQIANIACGGHAGDRESVAAFRFLAERNGVAVAGHLSYPDRENFGRVSMEMDHQELLWALNEQYHLIPDIKTIKFHGALYNDACVDDRLAGVLLEWLTTNRITHVITPFDSRLAAACRLNGIHIIAEAFAERRYAFSEKSGQLGLVNRRHDYASIHNCEEAVRHAMNIVNNKEVNAYMNDGKGDLSCRIVPIQADTICIHSDSPIALELVQKLSELLANIQ